MPRSRPPCDVKLVGQPLRPHPWPDRQLLRRPRRTTIAAPARRQFPRPRLLRGRLCLGSNSNGAPIQRKARSGYKSDGRAGKIVDRMFTNDPVGHSTVGFLNSAKRQTSCRSQPPSHRTSTIRRQVRPRLRDSVHRRGEPFGAANALPAGAVSRHRRHRPGPAVPVPLFELCSPVHSLAVVLEAAGRVSAVRGQIDSRGRVRRAVADA